MMLVMLYKRYIPVITLIGKEGEVTPVAIIWEDINGSHTYKVDKVFNVHNAYSQVGGCGTLYECLILGRRRKLFFEHNRWFIECIKPN